MNLWYSFGPPRKPLSNVNVDSFVRRVYRVTAQAKLCLLHTKYLVGREKERHSGEILLKTLPLMRLKG